MGSHFLGSPRSQRLLAGKTPVLHVSRLPAKKPFTLGGFNRAGTHTSAAVGCLALVTFHHPRACVQSWCCCILQENSLGWFKHLLVLLPG